MTHRALVAVAVLLLAGVESGATQRAPAWDDGVLACAAFQVTVRSEFETRTGLQLRLETAGWEGLLRLRGTPGNGDVTVEAWWDSLHVWRDAPEGRTAPDTDGLVGGRYRGRLAPDGAYTPVAVPFLPPAVAEVADLRPLLDDFFPRVPRVPLQPDATTDAGDGLTIERIADSSGVTRFRWSLHRATGDTTSVLDTVAVAVRQRIREEGGMAWATGPGGGPLAWRRLVHVDATVPAGGAVRRSLRTGLTQRISVTRVTTC